LCLFKFLWHLELHSCMVRIRDPNITSGIHTGHLPLDTSTTSLFIIAMKNPNRRLHRTISRPFSQIKNCKLFETSTAITTNGLYTFLTTTKLLRGDKQSSQMRHPSPLQQHQIQRPYNNDHVIQPHKSCHLVAATMIKNSQEPHSRNNRGFYNYHKFYHTVNTNAKHLSDDNANSSFKVSPQGMSKLF
jgi:hypothetical protein